MDTATMVWTIITAVVKDVFNIENLLQTIAHLAYTLMSWVLSIIDFIFLIVRQIAGLNTDFSSLDTVIEGDIIFGFIFSDAVVSIMRNMVMLAIVVILVLGIIAIIKNEFNAIKDESNSGEIKNDKKGVWKNIFESILLLFLIPMILFGGMILSNGLLQTLDNYTRGHTSNASVGAKIFVASSYDANAFRAYAGGDKKIPITYSFNQVQDYSPVVDWDTSGRAAEIANNLAELKKQPEWIQGFATFSMFYTNLFYSMDTIDYLRLNSSAENNPYYSIYDKGIETYKYEYYANADAIDYMIETGTTLYYMTAQEIAAKASQTQINTGNYYTFNVNYCDGLEPVTYEHLADATDEAAGAVYLLCVQKTYIDPESGAEKTDYQPLINGKDGFVSYAVEEGSYIVARGLFDDAKYPTAIRKVNGNIEFYREKLNVPTFASFFPHISYELPEGATEDVGMHITRTVIQWATGINIADFVPYIYFDIDLMHLFGKSQIRVSTLKGGSFLQDYTFKNSTAGVFLSIFELDNKQMSLTYNNLRINWIVLVLASIIILRKLLSAIFGLLKRMVDIMILYVMYPAAVATIPLYGNSSLGSWTKRMFGKVTAMYGFIIGLNLGFLLLTPISSVNLITPEMLASNPAFAWMTNLFGIGGFGASVINRLIQILFYLVGIWFIFEIPKVVQKFVQAVDQDKDKGYEDIISSGEEVKKGVGEYYRKVADVVSGRALVNKVNGIKDFIPGSAIVTDIKNKAKQAQLKAALGSQEDDIKGMGKNLAQNFMPGKKPKGEVSGSSKGAEVTKKGEKTAKEIGETNQNMEKTKKQSDEI